MNALDPFALGGRQDDAALALFQRWIAAAREADALLDTPEYDAALDHMCEAENDIVACRGATALAVKTFFIFRHEHATWAPEPYVRLGGDEPDLAALRDAADLVPEIEELAAPIFHVDAKLIDADMEVTWARIVLAQPDACHWHLFPDGEERRLKSRREKEDRLAAALDIIASTEAKTARGEAIKAKHAGGAS